MPGKSQTPALRFAGFTGEWRKCVLSDVSNRFDNLRVPVAANLREPGTTPYYGANGVQDYVKGFTHEGEFVLIAEDGANDLKNYPIRYVEGRIWANNHVHIIQAIRCIADNMFLSYAIGRSDIESLLVGCGRTKLNANEMSGIPLRLPDISEQSAIGRFFRKVDALISQQQKKVEKLQGIKKGLMKKMFPRGGCTLPEVRFAGFDGEWVERKIGSEIVTLPFRDFLATPDMEGLHPIIQQGDFPIMGYSGRDPFDDFQNVVLFGDHTLSLYRPQEPFLIATDGIRIIHSKEKDADFLYYYLECYKPASEGYKRYFRILIDKEGKRPESTAEQSAIGRLFRKLDDLITLHGQKLEKLRHVKQALLGKMFV